MRTKNQVVDSAVWFLKMKTGLTDKELEENRPDIRSSSNMKQAKEIALKAIKAIEEMSKQYTENTSQFEDEISAIEKNAVKAIDAIYAPHIQKIAKQLVANKLLLQVQRLILSTKKPLSNDLRTLQNKIKQYLADPKISVRVFSEKLLYDIGNIQKPELQEKLASCEEIIQDARAVFSPPTFLSEMSGRKYLHRILKKDLDDLNSQFNSIFRSYSEQQAGDAIIRALTKDIENLKLEPHYIVHSTESMKKIKANLAKITDPDALDLIENYKAILGEIEAEPEQPKLDEPTKAWFAKIKNPDLKVVFEYCHEKIRDNINPRAEEATLEVLQALDEEMSGTIVRTPKELGKLLAACKLVEQYEPNKKLGLTLLFTRNHPLESLKQAHKLLKEHKDKVLTDPSPEAVKKARAATEVLAAMKKDMDAFEAMEKDIVALEAMKKKRVALAAMEKDTVALEAMKKAMVDLEASIASKKPMHSEDERKKLKENFKILAEQRDVTWKKIGVTLGKDPEYARSFHFVQQYERMIDAEPREYDVVAANATHSVEVDFSTSKHAALKNNANKYSNKHGILQVATAEVLAALEKESKGNPRPGPSELRQLITACETLEQHPLNSKLGLASHFRKQLKVQYANYYLSQMPPDEEFDEIKVKAKTILESFCNNESMGEEELLSKADGFLKVLREDKGQAQEKITNLKNALKGIAPEGMEQELMDRYKKRPTIEPLSIENKPKKF